MAQRLIHVSTVTHGGNAIGYAESFSWNEAARALALGPSDNDTWPDFIAAVGRSVTAQVRFRDSASLEDASLAIGASGTLSAKGKDPSGGAGDVTVNIANAVCIGKNAAFTTQQEAGFGLNFSAYSADGTTNPVSYA